MEFVLDKPVTIFEFDYLSEDNELAHVHLCIDLNRITKLPVAAVKQQLAMLKIVLNALAGELAEAEETIDMIHDDMRDGLITEMFDVDRQEYRYLPSEMVKQRMDA